MRVLKFDVILSILILVFFSCYFIYFDFTFCFFSATRYICHNLCEFMNLLIYNVFYSNVM